ncbi:ABC transporter substrate-binding protein [Mucilaginibacter sp. OK098]|uniref:ABC transporter substrate-binding protein n=1 Tax=Mucilaginibacter sp. OK098 TaxID=1855297 RepID=UPI000912B17E|nr:ABC transporter substrate-binding protein [Mucilaginibacter sp. OK098]SHN37850.1 branched-chain amino acid transport system substrate-binding protein [Mucilaginibacter sp. OK098]
MKRPLKIGLLSPYSSIYPFYAAHLTAGILLGMNLDPFRQNQVQFIPAYTKLGSAASTQEAANKLIFFDQIDILSGLISYQSIPDLIPTIDNHRKMGFFFDMGEYIPYFNHLSPEIFYSSQQIWQTQYALGNWAYKEYGDTGMMVMPLYESGYHLSNAFRHGAGDAGSKQMLNHIFPNKTGDWGQTELDVFFADVKKYAPAYVHAIFTGKQSSTFLTAWRASEFYKNIPLLVAENMVYDDVLYDVAHLDFELYATVSWNYDSEDVRNREFVKKFETKGGQKANIFGLLGYETGLALNAVRPQLDKQDWDGAKALLRKESIRGPRGERNFYPQSGFSLPITDVVRIKTTTNKIYKTVVSQGNGLKFDSANFKAIHEGCLSGWQNPYMCI